ncbi:phytoene desaturase family protein [Corynebacterium sp. MSK310]|uniref:phytoene desaturase family protein n=1 Tax=Corynebacterium sp. MSK310 TaxID=3050223 RepID=UPI00254AC8BE|nr:phytoene desaturase family protein [Corynebacterium sp. MSK310]MDK8476224.1 phytoene desaturase family protein [Corynebacterium sp. MSK310]
MHVVVIGAGIAGLATAALLGKEGYEVTVVDSLDEVGGRAGSYAEAGFRWDTGPSWYLMPDAFDHFFSLCGTSTEKELDLVGLSPDYRVYTGGPAESATGTGSRPTPVDVHSGTDNVAQLFESLEPGAGSQVRSYLADASDAYHVALDHFLYTTFSAPLNLVHADIRHRLARIAALLTTSLQKHVNGQFSDTRLRQILSYPAVFLSSEPAAAPALYSLLSHTDLVEGVRYPLGGFHAVVQAIYRQAEKFGATFRLDEEVTSITTTGGSSSRATGVRTTNGHIDADIVVSAADLHHTENQLLPRKLRTYPERYWARRNPGLGTVVVLAGVKGKLPELAHHTFLFSQDWDPDFRAVFSAPETERPLGASESIYISKVSATDADVAPEGHENLFFLIPVPAAEAYGHGDAYHPEASPRVAAIADAALDQLSRTADIPDLRERITITRSLGPADFADRYHSWSGGALGPAHTLFQSAFFRGRNASRKVAGLYYAGATTVPGVGVPMCLISAENIIKRLRGDTSAGPLPTDDA